MNRTGLLIALADAATVGLIFAIRPDLDLKLAALFFDPERVGFWRAYDPSYLRARDVAVWLVTLVSAPAWIALALKFIWPRRPLIIPGRAVVLMLLYTVGIMGVLTPYGTGPAPVWCHAGYITTREFWTLGLIFGLLYLDGLLLVGFPIALRTVTAD